MLRKLVLNRIEAAERSLGEPLEYLRHMARASLGAFFRFSLLSPLAWQRKHLPADAFYTAMIVASRHEDCGTCVQTVVNFAIKDGAAAETLRAVLDGRPGALDASLEAVYRFTESVVQGNGHAETLRDRLRERYGEAGLVELALGIARARTFPTIKRTLGYATSCAVVEVRV